MRCEIESFNECYRMLAGNLMEGFDDCTPRRIARAVVAPRSRERAGIFLINVVFFATTRWLITIGKSSLFVLEVDVDVANVDDCEVFGVLLLPLDILLVSHFPIINLNGKVQASVGVRADASTVIKQNSANRVSSQIRAIVDDVKNAWSVEFNDTVANFFTLYLKVNTQLECQIPQELLAFV